MDSKLTITMPIFGKPLHMVREAAESILADDAPLTLVLVSDACTIYDGLPDLKDPRIVRFTMERNRGTFYIQSLVLQVAKTEWWSVHDADDLSAPARFTKLLAAAQDIHSGSVGGSTIHYLNGNVTDFEVRAKPRGHGSASWIIHFPGHIFRTRALRKVGIPADMRTSVDSAITPLFWHRYQVAVVDEPLYIVRKTKDSLTTSLKTGMGTPWRNEMRAEQARRFQRALREGGRLQGSDKVEPADIRRLARVLL